MLYAIAFDLKMDALKENYSSQSPGNAYNAIRNFLVDDRHYVRQQRSLYFAPENMTHEQCLADLQELVKNFAWFPSCVRDIRILHIEKSEDLMPQLASSVEGR